MLERKKLRGKQKQPFFLSFSFHFLPKIAKVSTLCHRSGICQWGGIRREKCAELGKGRPGTAAFEAGLLPLGGPAALSKVLMPFLPSCSYAEILEAPGCSPGGLPLHFLKSCSWVCWSHSRLKTWLKTNVSCSFICGRYLGSCCLHADLLAVSLFRIK